MRNDKELNDGIKESYIWTNSISSARSVDDGHAKAGAKTGGGSTYSENSVINVFH